MQVGNQNTDNFGELGDASFRMAENELGELGGMSFGILELVDASFRICTRKGVG